MPCKDDYVTYSTFGVCLVEDIRFIKFQPGFPGRDYYVLKPIRQDSASIFVPADNETLVARIRPVLSPEEVDRLIADVRDQSLPWIHDRKQRLDAFQGILSRGDTRELLLMARCLYLKSKESLKGLPMADMQILKKVQEMIEQEFSFSLNRSDQQVGGYIREKLGLTAELCAPT